MHMLGKPVLENLAESVGGPVLAALATAFGVPQLAPAALAVGGQDASLAVKGVTSSTSTSSSTKAQSEAGSPDERMAMFELQRQVEKQQQMFVALSNTMKAMHDTQMAIVHNIR